MTPPTDLTADLVELAPHVPAAAVPHPHLREVSFTANAWLPDEDDTLRRMFAADASLADIAAELDRPFHGTRSRVCQLGLRRNSARPWLAEEDAEVLARYGTESCASIAQDLGRSVNATYARAWLLGVSEEISADWDEWEDTQLREGYRRAVPVGQLATLIGRPLLGARSRASLLGLRHPAQPPGWSDAEATRALELAGEGHRYLAIIESLVAEGYPRRSKNGFGQHIRILGYGRGWGRPWTEEEHDLVRATYARGESVAKLARRLSRSRSTLSWKAGELGLKGTHPDTGKGWCTERKWTPEDEDVLRAEYGKTPNKELAAKLDRKWSACQQRAHALKLYHGWMRAFTPDEDRALLIAWKTGLSMVDLSETLDRDPAVVGKRCRRAHGVGFNDPDRPARGPKTRRADRKKLSLADILAMEPA